ncbi:MAG: carbohydrate-binding protein, partial [Fibrobacter sp.]|nr:carbohydrate-binding protein [Fibrobacter sp.]
KGRSFFFYHNQKNVNGGGYSRSTAVEEFTWNADGTIPTIKSTNDGVKKPIKNLDPFERVEAETKSWVGGISVDKPRDPEGGNYTIIKHVAKQGDNVYLTNMGSNFYTKVRSVDMGDGADKIIVCTRGKAGKIELHTKSENGATLATIDVPASDSWQENSFDLKDAAGVEDLFFVVKQGGFDFDYWYMESEKSAVPQTPYNGKVAAIPGKIEAENYDEGGHNKAFYDNDRANQGGAYREDEVDIVQIDSTDKSKGYALGYTEDGEWVEYTVNNEAAAEYTVQLNMATASEDVGVQLFIDDKEITDVIKAEKGEDWSTYSTVTAKTKEIAKGEHVLKMKIVGNFVNVDWIKFCKEADCKDNVGIRTARVNLQIPEKIYAVFGMTGKFLGNVEVNGQSIAKSIRSAGFTPGVYMVRSAGQSKTFRVLVK